MKAIGRYDRGILNYRFVPKGKWIGGLTFSYVNLDSDNSSMLYAILGDMDATFTMKSIHPFVGYALKDNVVVGAKFGYSHIVGDLGNIDLNLGDDLSFNIGNMRYTEDMYSFGVFNRSYVGLDENGIFGLFNETALTYKRLFLRPRRAGADLRPRRPAGAGQHAGADSVRDHSQRLLRRAGQPDAVPRRQRRDVTEHRFLAARQLRDRQLA